MSSSLLTLVQSLAGPAMRLEEGATGLGVALLLALLEASIGDECASDILTSSAIVKKSKKWANISNFITAFYIRVNLSYTLFKIF